MRKSENILILGFGNTILSDDGIGVKIAQEIKNMAKDDSVECVYGNIRGLTILDYIVGYDRLVVIDAIQTKDGEIGDVIDFGNEFRLNMPKTVNIYAIEVKDVTTFSDRYTPILEKRIPEIVQSIAKEIFDNSNGTKKGIKYRHNHNLGEKEMAK